MHKCVTALLFSDLGSVTVCSCNLNHNFCSNNNTCETDLRCHRIIEIDYISYTIKRDEQLCPHPNQPIGDDALNCSPTLSHTTSTSVSFTLCCRGTDYCNTNDTAIYEVLRNNGLGVCVCVCMCT